MLALCGGDVGRARVEVFGKLHFLSNLCVFNSQGLMNRQTDQRLQYIHFFTARQNRLGTFTHSVELENHI